MPLARRLVLDEPRRFVSGAAGVGLALMLILLLQGLSAGIDERVVIYERRSGADLYVAQPGTTSLLGSTSVLERSALDEVRGTPGVDWAAPMRGLFTIPVVDGARVPAYVVGSEPGQPGGPWDLAEGRAPAAPDEIVVGEQLVRRSGASLGGTVEVLGRDFEVVGIARDADLFMMSFAFVTHEATDQLLSAPDTTSFVLVGTDDPTGVATALGDGGLHVVSADDLAANDLALKGEAYSVALQMMVGLAFVVGTLVIALTVYGSIVERSREYGIVKALGAGGGHLYRLVLIQSLLLAAMGTLAGVGMFLVGTEVLGALRPQFAVAVSQGAALRVAMAALAMGVVSTWLPARRLAAMEPAVAFGGG